MEESQVWFDQKRLETKLHSGFNQNLMKKYKGMDVLEYVLIITEVKRKNFLQNFYFEVYYSEGLGVYKPSTQDCN